MTATRGPRYLLRNGLDYLSYQQYERALKFLREAEALGHVDYFLVSGPKDLAMYSDAVKVVGADFEVADLATLVERALADAEVAVTR